MFVFRTWHIFSISLVYLCICEHANCSQFRNKTVGLRLPKQSGLKNKLWSGSVVVTGVKNCNSFNSLECVHHWLINFQRLSVVLVCFLSKKDWKLEQLLICFKCIFVSATTWTGTSTASYTPNGPQQNGRSHQQAPPPHTSHFCM